MFCWPRKQKRTLWVFGVPGTAGNVSLCVWRVCGVCVRMCFSCARTGRAGQGDTQQHQPKAQVGCLYFSLLLKVF